MTSTSRRTVLRSAGLVALAGSGASALAACSPDTPDPQTPGTQTAPPGAAPSTSVPTSEVSEGSGVVLADTYVVTQPSSGEYKAFSALCTHAGCVVAGVQDGEIVCACHGSHFSISDGSVLSGPARSALPSVDLTESGSDLVVEG